MEYVFIACLVAAVFIVGVFFHYDDIGNIRASARKKGWQKVRIEWSFFDNLFDDDDRCYRVRYVDQNGMQHRTHCKISTLRGLYWLDEN